jgi:di/tricarboxylate transporter
VEGGGGLSTEIALTLGVLGLTVVLFVTELFRVDVTAIIVMLLLPWLGLIEPLEAFSGFASNAVIAMIAVMILGYGIDASGAMKKLSGHITRLAAGSESRLLGMVSAAVGLTSAFMQNIGATILYLPAVRRISRQSGFHLPRLLMPMGFAAILGGTLTMVASGPMIILNDLLRQGGERPFGLFRVTPVGLVLLAAGIVYFLIAGRRLLPRYESGDKEEDLADEWDIPAAVRIVDIPEGSPLVGLTVEEADLWEKGGIHLLAQSRRGDVLFSPWRGTVFREGDRYALIGEPAPLQSFIETNELAVEGGPCALRKKLESEDAGFAEVVVRPRSQAEGSSIRRIAMRKRFGVEPLVIVSAGESYRGDISDRPLKGGDTLVVHGPFSGIASLGRSGDFLLTGRVPETRSLPERPLLAVMMFAVGIALAILGFRLSLSLMTAAMGMVLLRVITIDEAYRAVEWRTVFLLAGLLPLGLAMERSGAASFLASSAVSLVSGTHPLVLMTAVALLATLFTLFMSNVAATVLLAPLVMLMASDWGIDPRALAILVAVCASNSFVLPTHQVNALLMAPGGYRNKDYMRAGGGMTLLFIAVAVPLVYLLFT